jgi:hypothetical protein
MQERAQNQSPSKNEIQEILESIKFWAFKVSESATSRLLQLETDNVIDDEAILDRYRPLQDCVRRLQDKGTIHYFGKYRKIRV